MGNALLDRVVHRHAPLTPRGLLERTFTASFRGLVYTWVGEDPEVDLAALALERGSRVVAIGSAGCNVLSYLGLAEPAAVVAVDLNPAQLALTRLKAAAVRHLSYEDVFQLFGVGEGEASRVIYWTRLRPHLDVETRRFWELPGPGGGRWVDRLADGLYRHGLSGRFIGALHRLARLHGIELSGILRARTLAEQRAVFDRTLAPLFARGLVRGACNLPIAMFGLGVPPAQLARLRAESDDAPADVFAERVRRLACDHTVETNYFAWQVFGRRYDVQHRRAVPPYLQSEVFARLKRRVDALETVHASITAYLRGQPDRSVDRFVLLDAQDWMSAAQLAELWREIGRTARPGARAIFRTLASASPLEGTIPDHLRDGWRPDPSRGRALLACDRTGVYGGFHLYSAS